MNTSLTLAAGFSQRQKSRCGLLNFVNLIMKWFCLNFGYSICCSKFLQYHMILKSDNVARIFVTKGDTCGFIKLGN